MKIKVQIETVPGIREDITPEELEKLFAEMKNFWQPLFEKIPDDTKPIEPQMEIKKLKSYFDSIETETLNVIHKGKTGSRSQNTVLLPPKPDSDIGEITQKFIEHEEFEAALSILAALTGSNQSNNIGGDFVKRASINFAAALKKVGYYSDPSIDLGEKISKIDEMMDDAQQKINKSISMLETARVKVGLKKPAKLWEERYTRNSRAATINYIMFIGGATLLIAIIVGATVVAGLNLNSENVITHKYICNPKGDECELLPNYILYFVCLGFTGFVSMSIWLLKTINRKSQRAANIANYNDEQIAFTESYLTFESEGELTPEMRAVMLATTFARGPESSHDDSGPEHIFASLLQKKE